MNSDTFVAINGTWCSLTIMYFFCYIAEDVCNKFEEIGNSIYQLNWFHYPPSVQKSLLIIIRQTQRPIRFHGYNVIFCDMPTFAKVIENKKKIDETVR